MAGSSPGPDRNQGADYREAMTTANRKSARQGWDEAFAKAIEEEGTDSEPLLPDFMSEGEASVVAALCACQ